MLIFLKFPHLSVPGLSCGMWDFLGGAWAFPVGDVGFSRCGMPAPERAGLVAVGLRFSSSCMQPAGS